MERLRSRVRAQGMRIVLDLIKDEALTRLGVVATLKVEANRPSN